MNLTDFDKDLAKKFNVSQKEARKMLSFLNKRIEEKLFFGTEITFRNVGTIVIKVLQPRKYLNLQTNEMQMRKRRFVLGFRMTRKMNEKMKKKTVYGYSDSQSHKHREGK